MCVQYEHRHTNSKSDFFSTYSSPYRSRPISVITPPVSPPPEQVTAEEDTEKPKDTTENDSQQSSTEQNKSNEDNIVSHSNGTAMKTLRSKPQTSQHKFFAAGQKKSLSSSNLLAEKKDSPECSSDQISKETGDESTQLPDVKVDQGNQIDSNMDNLFNV